MDDTGVLGGALNQLGQTAKQTAKQVVKLPGQMAKDAGEQLGGAPLRQGSEGQAKSGVSTEPKQGQWQSDKEREEFLKHLYGFKDKASAPSLDAKKTSVNPLVSSKDKLSEFQEQIKDKTPEEQQELMTLRNQLHKENYYDPTFNPVKNPPAGGEERPAEKVENEKKKEMQDLQKKEAEKPQPIAVARSQKSAEMFRGAAG
jgi:hypothetical protein